MPVPFLERFQLRLVLGEPAVAGALGLLLVAPDCDVPFELVQPYVLADAFVLGLAELDRAESGEVLRVLGSLNQVLRRDAFGQRRAALFPDLRDIVFPAIPHALDVAIGAAQQEHHGLQRVAARQHREVLHHDGFEQRSHQLVGRHPHLLKPVDIGLGENAALAGHGVQLHPVVAHLAKLLGGDAELGVDLVDHRPRASRALIVHGRQLLLAARLGIFLEDDDLGVLPAELDHAAAFRVQLLHRERNRVDLLHELRPEKLGHPVAARTRDKNARGGRLETFDFGLEALQELQHLLRLLGIVALVIGPHHPVARRIHHHGLHRRGADIHADKEFGFHV